MLYYKLIVSWKKTVKLSSKIKSSDSHIPSECRAQLAEAQPPFTNQPWEAVTDANVQIAWKSCSLNTGCSWENLFRFTCNHHLN